MRCALQAGNHSAVNASDSACEALVDTLPTNVVNVTTRARVLGRLHQHTIATCPGIFNEIRGEVEGIGPWWLEIRRNGVFWRRIRHPREAVGGVEDAFKGAANKTQDLVQHFAFEVEAPGEYTLHSVTDSTQCLAHGTGTVIVSEKPAPEVRLQKDGGCEGDALVLDVNSSGSCFVTVMASGWAAPREIELTLGSMEETKTKTGEVLRMVRNKVALFGAGEAQPGQYTITAVRDAECSAATSQTVTVHPRPEIMMRGSATHVCADHAAEDWATLEVRANGSFMGKWGAVILYPNGHEEKVSGFGSEARLVKVSEPGTYALAKAFSLNPRCAARLQPHSAAKRMDAEIDHKGRTVTVTRLETPRATLSGGGTVCQQGGTGAMVDLVVQVTGGKGPYRIKFARDGLQDPQFRQVIAPDGRLVVPVRNKGSYSIVEVQDTHRCSRKQPSNTIQVSLFPTAVAAFTQQYIGLCPGDGPQQASVGVTGKNSPAPWQLAVLRNGRYHTNGQVANSSLTAGNFEFNTEEVVDGQRGVELFDEYHVDKDSFTDARGCLGEVRGVLKVKMNALPSVEVVAGARHGKLATCEDEAAMLNFTAGSSPWSITIQMRPSGGGSLEVSAIPPGTSSTIPPGTSSTTPADTFSKAGNVAAGSTCEISGITDRHFSLAALKDVAQHTGTRVGRGAGGGGILRTTCVGPSSGQGFLAPGYHVRSLSILTFVSLPICLTSALCGVQFGSHTVVAMCAQSPH